MAGIDKTYCYSYKEYKEFKDWADKQVITFFDGLKKCVGKYVYYYDETRNKNLGIATIQTDAGRNNDIVTNIYLRGEGNTPTNLNGFVLPWNATLVAISMSGRSNTQVWSAQVRVNGSTTPIDFLTISNQFSKYNNSKNTDFMAGDRVQIFCSGVNIEYPNVALFFRRRF
jgi:hypothetical protein